MTLFEMKEKLNTLKSAILADANWLAEKAADPSTKMEEIKEKQAHRDELQARYDTLKAEHDRMEAEQKTAVAAQAVADGSMTAEQNLIAAKAAFYRAVFSGKPIDAKAYEGLGAIPAANADLGSGDKLLPTNLARELLVEPYDVNPLRNIVRITNITGLEEPKLGYTIEDADLADVTDKQTANEIALEGDTVHYGRYKIKVSATLKDTILHGTDLDVVTAVEGALRAALAKREKYFAFLSAEAAATDTTHAHMSFYAAANGIIEVNGATEYEAIVNALADLADDYAANAGVVMTKSAYYGMIKELANNSDRLFDSKPASILGYPVTFCDKATIPVVGDFNYYGINYDIGTIFETDKDAKKGEYYYVLTAWGDQQIRMKSAFRLAKVGE